MTRTVTRLSTRAGKVICDVCGEVYVFRRTDEQPLDDDALARGGAHWACVCEYVDDAVVGYDPDFPEVTL